MPSPGRKRPSPVDTRRRGDAKPTAAYLLTHGICYPPIRFWEARGEIEKRSYQISNAADRNKS